MMVSAVTSAIPERSVVRSGKLIQRLQRRGRSSDYARQLLLRAGRDTAVWRSEQLKLPRGERVFARTTFTQSPEFLPALAQVLAEVRPGLARCLSRLAEQKVLLMDEVAQLTGAVVHRRVSGVPSLEEVVESLLDTSGACCREGEPSALDRLVTREVGGSDNARAIAFQKYGGRIGRAQVAHLLFDQYREQNIVSWSGCKFCSLESGYVSFNDYAFTAYGFSYLDPLLQWRKDHEQPVPCPTVLDVHSRTCDCDDIEALRHRMERASRGRPRTNRLLGVVAAPHFENNAWDAARRANLIVVNLRQLVGDKTLEALGEIESILSSLPGSLERVSQESIGRLGACIDELDNNPFVVALRSIAFEAVAVLVLRSHGFEQVEMGLVVDSGNGSREVDAIGVRKDGDEVRIIECKAYHASKELDVLEVDDFFTRVVPATLKNPAYTNAKSVSAELWTTGMVDEHVRGHTRSIKLKKRITPVLRDFEDIKQQLTPKLQRCIQLLGAIRARRETV